MKIEITHRQGGRYEYEQTGVYPRYLDFYVPSLDKTWTVQITPAQSKGEVIIDENHRFAYEYNFETRKLKVTDIDGNDMKARMGWELVD